MSPRAPGAPSDQEVNVMRLAAKEGTVSASKRYLWHSAVGDPNASNDFPLVPTRVNPYDDIANIKSQFAQGMAGKNWNVPFTTEDAAYMLSKRDDQERALFDVWVDHKFDLTDPAQVRMLQEIAPELYRRKEEMIDTMQNIASRYAKLRLRGPRTLDDLFLEWQVETGRVELPMGPVWNPKLWRALQSGNLEGSADKDQTWTTRRYQAGMFSPLRWMTKTTQGWGRNEDNPSDIYGTPGSYQGRIAAPRDALANWWSGYPVMYPATSGNLTADTEAMANGPEGQVYRDRTFDRMSVFATEQAKVNNPEARFRPYREAFAERERDEAARREAVVRGE